MTFRMMKLLIATLLVFALALGQAGLANALEVVTAVDGAKVYDIRGRVLGTLPANTALTLTGMKGSVCRVERDGKTAYMLKSDLKRAEAIEPQAEPQIQKSVTAYVAKDGAVVYSAGGEALGKLDQNTRLTVTAVKGSACRVTLNGRTGYMKKGDLSKSPVDKGNRAGGSSGVSTVTPARGTAVEMDWWTSDIQKIFARGTACQVTDVKTGISWREMRFGGTNHADCQPLTAADTAAMKKAYGGEWSWDRRAVFVTINGVNYAASINGMPHGSGESIQDNDFDGHHCIHFTNSRLHRNNKTDAAHQNAVKEAAAATLR